MTVEFNGLLLDDLEIDPLRREARLLLVGEVADDHLQIVIARHQLFAEPQALIVAPDKGSTLSASLPKTLSPAAPPEVMWAPVAAGRPFLFPSLGPTAYLQAAEPAHPASRLYNTAVGHLVGLGAGFLAVVILGVRDAPAVLTDHQLAAARMWAAVIALLVTVLVCLLLKATHPPAGATTLLVALGSIKTAADAINLIIGVVIIAIVGEVVRRVRLKGAMPRSV